MMHQPAASPNTAIRVITGILIAMDAAFYIGGLSERGLLPAAGVLTAVLLLCYLFWSPVGYELDGDELRVLYRVGGARFAPVVRCTTVDAPLRGALRLWGNGGVFSASGIFWSRALGVFRAYLTRTAAEEVILVETERTKILISPEEPRAWLAGCRAGRRGE